MACDILFGESSPLYNRLYTEGLINGEFGGGYELLPGISFVVTGGESKSPRKVHLAIMEEAERLNREGVSDQLWQQIRRATYGGLLRGLNSFESIAVGVVESAFRGYDYFRFPEIFASIEKVDVEQFISENITPDRATISMIHPKQKSEA